DPAGLLDAELERHAAADLAEAAEYVRVLAPRPRRLRGLHAAFALDEVTLLAVPDAAQRPWSEVTLLEPPAPPPVKPPPPPDEPTSVPCATDALEAPVLPAGSVDDHGRAALVWEAPDAAYRLETAADGRDFSAARILYLGLQRAVTVSADVSGPFYRVRAEARGLVSPWSNVVTVRAAARARWEHARAPDYPSDAL